MERNAYNVTFAANSETLIKIGKNNLTFQLCLDFHLKDRIKNSNHVILKYALQKERLDYHIKHFMANYLLIILPSRLFLQHHLKIFVLGSSSRC